MTPTIKDVLDFCQDVYRKTALFGDAVFVAEFNARVTAIGRAVCAEQGVPFATNNGLLDSTPLGAYAQQLFTELVALPPEPIDQDTLDEWMSGCDRDDPDEEDMSIADAIDERADERCCHLDDSNDCDDYIDIEEPTARHVLWHTDNHYSLERYYDELEEARRGWPGIGED